MTTEVDINMKIKPELPVLAFESQEKWAEWLSLNFRLDSGIWLRIYKKGSNVPSVNYDQALDEALCYGWIDGQKKKFDDLSFIQKFTPRRAKSMWSKRNIEHISRLESLGKIQSPGWAAINEAKEDGRWAKAYDSPSQMTIPEDFIDLLSTNPEAKEFFESLNKTNRYSIAWRLQTSKTAKARSKMMDKILTMMAEKKKFHD